MMMPTTRAVVLVMDPPMTRVGAIVYRMPDGLGWIEPGYFDDFPNPRPQWHQFAGKITETDDGILLQSEAQAILVLDLERVGEDYPQVVRELAELEARLAEKNTSLAEQRLILAQQVGASG